MSEKTYVSVWVNKDIAEEIKKLESTSNEKAIVQQVAKSLNLNIEQELSQLDDDLARYKAACIVFKNSLKEVYHAQQLEIEDIINSQWEIMPTIKEETRKMITQINTELLPLNENIETTKQSVESLKKEIGSIQFWYAEQMLKLVEQINTMDETSKELLKFMMNTYKKGE